MSGLATKVTLVVEIKNLRGASRNDAYQFFVNIFGDIILKTHRNSSLGFFDENWKELC